MTDREAFEAWAISDGGYHRSVPMHKDHAGEYVDRDLNEAWETWQAAIASQAAELAALRAALIWYADEARAFAKNTGSEKHTAAEALLASVTVLALDGGRRADAAMATHKEPSNE